MRLVVVEKYNVGYFQNRTVRLTHIYLKVYKSEFKYYSDIHS